MIYGFCQSVCIPTINAFFLVIMPTLPVPPGVGSSFIEPSAFVADMFLETARLTKVAYHCRQAVEWKSDSIYMSLGPKFLIKLRSRAEFCISTRITVRKRSVFCYQQPYHNLHFPIYDTNDTILRPMQHRLRDVGCQRLGLRPFCHEQELKPSHSTLLLTGFARFPGSCCGLETYKGGYWTLLVTEWTSPSNYK